MSLFLRAHRPFLTLDLLPPSYEDPRDDIGPLGDPGDPHRKILNDICQGPFAVKGDTFTGSADQDADIFERWGPSKMDTHVTLGKSLHIADRVGALKGPRREGALGVRRLLTQPHYGTEGPLGQVGC